MLPPLTHAADIWKQTGSVRDGQGCVGLSLWEDQPQTAPAWFWEALLP